MAEPKFSVLPNAPTSFPIKAWNDGVVFDEKAILQLQNISKMPFIYKWIAAMPDCHWGNGCTIGSVIPTLGAIIPSAVGVDIGCGMIACLTNLKVENVQDRLEEIFHVLSCRIPNGRTNDGGEGDRGAWHDVPKRNLEIFELTIQPEYDGLCKLYPGARSRGALSQFGTLGTGNHFVEVSADKEERIWIVIHSGSRGLGNRIGSFFTRLAKEECESWFVDLPDPELAYLARTSRYYDHYRMALALAQRYAWNNRKLMLDIALDAIGAEEVETVHCHHNYMAEEKHFGQNVLLTRKGAVRAEEDDVVIIPGSMGARTYIARGLGSVQSFKSCSHGAGRLMGRNQARNAISVEAHVAATAGIVCHKGTEVIDESPAAYKPIEAVMAAQSDLVEPIHELHQLVCVKGLS